MMIEIRGNNNAAQRRFAIVAARFNDHIVKRLVDGAVEVIVGAGGSEQDILIVRVPGSFEIPPVVSKLAYSGEIDAIIAVGCLLKGDTDHYELISQNVAAELSKTMTATGVPCTLGVICGYSMKQAEERAGDGEHHYGKNAASAAIELLDVMGQVEKTLENNS